MILQRLLIVISALSFSSACFAIDPLPLGAGTGLLGEYFNTAEFRGPVIVTRTDPAINFDWGSNGPAFGIAATRFSVRWTGQLLAPVAGAYTLATMSDDGVRLWVNGRKVIDAWPSHAVRKDAAQITFDAGKRYDIRLEYFNQGLSSTMKLLWTQPGQSEQVVSMLYLYAPATTYLSDLTATSAVNGEGPVERDQGNGATPQNDGQQISINGVKYSKGLGVRGTSDVKFNLNGQYLNFISWIGIDDEITANGQANFEVYLDGVRIYASPTLRSAQFARYVQLNVVGKNELRLVVTDPSSGTNAHADWADARLTRGVYLSDLSANVVANGWGPMEKDRSNGETAAADGRTLSISGMKFLKGLGVHAASDIRYALNSQYATFNAVIGVDDEVGTSGSVVFQVFTDGAKVYESAVIHGKDPGQQIEVDVRGKNELRLVVTEAGDGISFDHSDWADAKLIHTDPNTSTVTPGQGLIPPTGLTASAGDTTVTLNWNAVAGATSYTVYKGTMSGQAPSVVAMVTTTNYTVTGLGNGTTYYFRVTSFAGGTTSSFSNQVSATPTPGPPPAPTGLIATQGNGQITLLWNQTPGAMTYTVYRGTASIGSTSSTSFLVTGLTNGVTYSFRVTAANIAGQSSPFSNELMAAPTANPQPPAGGTPTLLQSWRFLRQSSFGPTQSTLDRVQAIGMDAFLNEQFAAPASVFPDSLITDPSFEYIQEYFMRLAVAGEDQLRMRVAFALHQIFVVSSVEVDNNEAYVRYLRILQDGAFGNFFDLMRNITLTPAMGEYLDMVNNAKADPVSGFFPNENYARELMQLFTIGLVQLNADGTQKLDVQGSPLPTYDNNGVKEMARVLTGWTYASRNRGVPTELRDSPYYGASMVPVEKYHDTGAKTVFGQSMPVGQTATQDLDQGLRILFNHANVGPFISRNLIQHLVTSNPSTTYVRDVAAVFNNNGSGVRGDLKTVVRAILTHAEAQQQGAAGGGKLMEPALFLTSVVRPLTVFIADHPFMTDLSAEMAQRIYSSPSVFNYFSPGYRIPNNGQPGPEFQIYTTATALTHANFVARFIDGGFGNDLTLNLQPFTSIAGNASSLVDKVAQVFLGGQLPLTLRNAILTAVNAAPGNEEKAQTALYLVLSSPYYQVDH